MKRILILLLLGISKNITAQLTPDLRPDTAAIPAPTSKFINRLSLRQSFQGQLEREEAAFLNLVYPQNKESSEVFSFAIGYNVFNPNVRLTALRPFFEWQRNSATDKEQNVLLSGLSFQWIAREVIASDRSWTPVFLINANYKNDKVKSTEGMQASFYFTPIFNGRGGRFLLLPDVVASSDYLDFYYNLYTGLEYENRSKAKNPTEDGQVTRFYNRVSAYFYPFSKALKGRLEVVADYTYRHALSNSSGVEKDHNRIFKFSTNMVLFTKKTSGVADVKIGVDYVNGVDPTKGFEDQQMKMVTLKVKI